MAWTKEKGREYKREYHKRYRQRNPEYFEQQKRHQAKEKAEKEEWLANLSPEHKAMQKEADRLSREWGEANKQGRPTGDLRERHHVIIARLQNELIPLRTYSIYEHTEPDLDGAFKIHAPNNRRFLYE